MLRCKRLGHLAVFNIYGVAKSCPGGETLTCTFAMCTILLEHAGRSPPSIVLQMAERCPELPGEVWANIARHFSFEE